MRELPAGKLGEMTGARKRLVAALVSGARDNAPSQAAHAQVMFDCWMQEQEENFQADDIARCRTGFMTAMAKVDEAMMPPPAPKPVAAKPPPAPAPKAMPKPAKQTFVVYFPFDSDKLTPVSKRFVLEAIDAAKSMGAKRIAVYRHTDTAGAKRYNAALADRRTQTVAKELAAGGLSERSFNLGSFGEVMPAVATADGVKLQQNRRVEIEISK